MSSETGNPKLRKLFRKVTRQMALELDGFAKALRAGSPHRETLDKAYSIAHSLHGAGEPYGHPCLSELGAALEKVIAALRSGDLAAAEPVIGLFDSSAAALRDLSADAAPKAVCERVRDLAWNCQCALRGNPSSDRGGRDCARPLAP